jgi:hypothetical protein
VVEQIGDYPLDQLDSDGLAGRRAALNTSIATSPAASFIRTLSVCPPQAPHCDRRHFGSGVDQ